ncbi:hypothetical protein J2W48_001559 [Flavobacterium piscis]|uniref:Uncharacterized protein n=1 Tax=Flavobacterium piscis TaxID=1114874 RepID=A0ABU1Y7Z6_9FLAO|nr:hypothetical protein [Flavobacterium piscis]
MARLMVPDRIYISLGYNANPYVGTSTPRCRTNPFTQLPHESFRVARDNRTKFFILESLHKAEVK